MEPAGNLIAMAAAVLKQYDDPMITTVNLPEELHAQLKQVADEDRRSMNATIVVAVEQYVAARSHRARVRELAEDVAGRDAELLERLAR
jgi:predicted transcriptional regulator